MTKYFIQPLPGYTPTIGRLVGMLSYARTTTLQAVEGLSRDELDYLQDPRSNSIGALLAHVASTELWYQVLCFEDRKMTAEEEAPYKAAFFLGDEGRRVLRGRDLQSYLDELAGLREVTLAKLAQRDDEWLERPLVAKPEYNGHWAWFHVAEDEISHRGQMRWLRARLPGASPR